MFSFVASIVNRNKDKDVKRLILKEFFNYSNHKKIIGKAARESAADQRVLLEQYERKIRAKKEDFALSK